MTEHNYPLRCICQMILKPTIISEMQYNNDILIRKEERSGEEEERKSYNLHSVDKIWTIWAFHDC